MRYADICYIFAADYITDIVPLASPDLIPPSRHRPIFRLIMPLFAVTIARCCHLYALLALQRRCFHAMRGAICYARLRHPPMMSLLGAERVC